MTPQAKAYAIRFVIRSFPDGRKNNHPAQQHLLSRMGQEFAGQKIQFYEPLTDIIGEIAGLGMAKAWLSDGGFQTPSVVDTQVAKLEAALGGDAGARAAVLDAYKASFPKAPEPKEESGSDAGQPSDSDANEGAGAGGTTEE